MDTRDAKQIIQFSWREMVIKMQCRLFMLMILWSAEIMKKESRIWRSEVLSWEWIWNQRREELKYFLGIKMAKSKKGIVTTLSQYTLDLLEETGKLGVKSIDILIKTMTYILKVVTSWVIVVSEISREVDLFNDHRTRYLICSWHGKPIHTCTSHWSYGCSW